MNSVQITLQFSSYAEAASALAKLGGIIDPADSPAAGVVVSVAGLPPAAEVTPVNPFAAEASNPFAAAAVVPSPAAPASSDAVLTPTPPAASTTPPAPPAASPLPSAPAATAAVPPAGVATIQRDKNNLRWDGRIHSSTKGINKDGTWRVKKNLDEATRLQVETELKAELLAGVPTPAAPPVAAPQPTATVPVPPAPATSTAPVPAAATPATATPAASVPAPGPATETFGTLMAKLAPHMAVPEKNEVINKALADFKLGSLAGLAGRGDLVAPFAAYVLPLLAA